MTDDQYRVSKATCMACGYKWIAVKPDGCEASLECPSCHARWGIEENPDGEEVEP